MSNVRWLALLVVVIMPLFGCSRVAEEDPMAISPLTGAEVEPLLEPGLTTYRLKEALETVPVLISDNEFRWFLRDGSLITQFLEQPNGTLRIIGWSFDSSSTMANGGELMELGAVLSRYYEQPEPERLPRVMLTASSLGLLQEEGAAPPIVSFYAFAYRQSPERAEEWIGFIQELPREDRWGMYDALWRCDVDETRRLLQYYEPSRHPEDAAHLRELASTRPTPLLEREIETASNLDELWGGFFATGDPRFIERLCSVFEWTEADLNRDGARLLIHGAARWSVTSNIDQHEAVRAICTELAANAEGEARATLEEALAGGR